MMITTSLLTLSARTTKRSSYRYLISHLDQKSDDKGLL